MKFKFNKLCVHISISRCILYMPKYIVSTLLTVGEIASEPLLLFTGPWSTGKTTMINYLVGMNNSKHMLHTGKLHYVQLTKHVKCYHLFWNNISCRLVKMFNYGNENMNIII